MLYCLYGANTNSNIAKFRDEQSLLILQKCPVCQISKARNFLSNRFSLVSVISCILCCIEPESMTEPVLLASFFYWFMSSFFINEPVQDCRTRIKLYYGRHVHWNIQYYYKLSNHWQLVPPTFAFTLLNDNVLCLNCFKRKTFDRRSAWHYFGSFRLQFTFKLHKQC